MSILNIRPAQRESAKVVVGLSGQSGGGKTYTALLIAMGMVKGDPTKIGLLDTENKRGSLYADMFSPHQFLVGDLEAPFSPSRYIQAIKEFESSGIEVLIIDSVSHEWEGEGGCEDIAEEGKARLRGTPDWMTAKREHKKFVNALLQSNMHIIACTRAREKVKTVQVVEGGKTKTKFEPAGVQPICEKNFMFEMTCSLMMYDNGQRQEVLKSCEGLQLGLGFHDGFIGESTGKNLIDWVEGATASKREELMKFKQQMAECESLDALKDIWTALTKEQRTQIGAGFLNQQKKRFETVEDDPLSEAGL